MDLQYLNLDLHNIPQDESTQVTVFLIAADLKCRMLIKGLTSIGCDACFCIPEFCDLVLAYVGFNDRPNELYDYYFELLDRHCDRVNHRNDPPIREAMHIYNQLMQDRAVNRFT